LWSDGADCGIGTGRRGPSPLRHTDRRSQAADSCLTRVRPVWSPSPGIAEAPLRQSPT
jgi:hypothetical protein